MLKAQRQMICLVLFLMTILFSACSGGDDGTLTDPAKSSEWDKMEWDKGTWK